MELNMKFNIYNGLNGIIYSTLKYYVLIIKCIFGIASNSFEIISIKTVRFVFSCPNNIKSLFNVSNGFEDSYSICCCIISATVPLTLEVYPTSLTVKKYALKSDST